VVGASRLKPGVRDLAKIWITPGSAALGLAFAIPMQADHGRRRVLLPGSALPLLRILIIFGSHYVLRVAAAIHPEMGATYLSWDIHVSGASAGYFMGWSIRFMMSYAKAPPVDPAASTVP
jgi:hypothetical protein